MYGSSVAGGWAVGVRQRWRVVDGREAVGGEIVTSVAGAERHGTNSGKAVATEQIGRVEVIRGLEQAVHLRLEEMEQVGVVGRGAMGIAT